MEHAVRCLFASWTHTCTCIGLPLLLAHTVIDVLSLHLVTLGLLSTFLKHEICQASQRQNHKPITTNQNETCNLFMFAQLKETLQNLTLEQF